MFVLSSWSWAISILSPESWPASLQRIILCTICLCSLSVFATPAPSSKLTCQIAEVLADPQYANNDQFWRMFEKLKNDGNLSELTLRNLKLKHAASGARNFPKMSGKTLEEMKDTLKKMGFVDKGKNEGAYLHYIHEQDRSEIFVRDNGEVLRLSRELKSPKGASFHQRYGSSGDLLLDTHSTGEFLVMPKK